MKKERRSFTIEFDLKDYQVLEALAEAGDVSKGNVVRKLVRAQIDAKPTTVDGLSLRETVGA